MSGARFEHELFASDSLSAAPNSKPVEHSYRPAAEGLYDPSLEKDSCGVGFIADIKGRA
jgi:glutamate synthase (NADPH) large chain